MRKIKIAFMLDTIDYLMGGSEKQLLLLLNGLNKDKFEPYLCFHKYSQWIKDNQTYYNIFFFDFPSFYKLRSYANWFKLVAFFKKEKIDIVQPIFRDSYILGIIASKLAGIKNIVVARRNLGYWINPTELFILKILYKVVPFFLVNSNSIAESLVKNEGISKKKITVIYNGLDFNYTDKQLPQKLPEIKESDFLVVTVANLRKIKGLDTIIDAARIVHKNSPNTRFWIIGEGSERSILENKINDLNLKNVVYLTGHLSDVRSILKKAYLGVLSSHMEGLSNSIIEYMAAGLPVVCTDVGGASELIENDINGYLVPVKSAQKLAQSIIKIIKNVKLAEIMGKNSRQKAKMLFDKNIMIKSTEEYYLKIINHN